MELGDYKKAFVQANTDLERLMEEREEIDRKISKLKQAIIGLAPLAEEYGADNISAVWGATFAAAGITDAIREILNTAEKPLAPLEIRDRLVQLKPNVKEQVNLMASIHTVLKRLVPKEASSKTTREGDVVYFSNTQNAAKTRFFAAAIKAMKK